LKWENNNEVWILGAMPRVGPMSKDPGGGLELCPQKLTTASVKIYIMLFCHGFKNDTVQRYLHSLPIHNEYKYST